MTSGVLCFAASPLRAQRADTVVKIAGAPVHAGIAKLVREVSIGVVDGADEYVLGSVSEIAVASDGSIYIYDRHVPALRKYDSNGKFVKTFGRRGQGPGEYMAVNGVALARDGRVFLWDTGNWRMNVYAPNSDLVTSWPTPSGSSGSASMGGARALMIDTAGRVYAKRSIFERPQRVPPRQVWIRYRADGSTIDTLEMPTFAVSLPSLSATSPGGNGMSSTGVPFAAMPRWTMSPLGYLVTGVSDRYAFELHGKPSDPVVSVRRPNVPAIPVSNQERDSARAAVETSMRRVDAAWTWNGPPIPKNKPFYADLFAGDDGRIWVPVVAEVAPRIGAINMPGGAGPRGGAPPPRPEPPKIVPPKPKPALYDVFEPNGTYLGQVEIPPRFSSAVRRGDYVWGIEYDDDDVQKVTRFRIAWK